MPRKSFYLSPEILVCLSILILFVGVVLDTEGVDGEGGEDVVVVATDADDVRLNLSKF